MDKMRPGKLELQADSKRALDSTSSKKIARS